MKLRRITQIAAVAVTFAGLSLLVPLSYYRWHDDSAVAHASGVHVPTTAPKPPAKPGVVSGEPVAIQIPSLHMNLPIIPGYYYPATGQWTLTLDKAQYATPSVLPNNETGNTLIYGHYRPEVFAYLHLIKPGAKAIITTGNGYRFTYTYESSKAYDPTDTSIFLYQGAPRLTIQTCSGSFFQHRQMYYFKYNGYQKIK